MTSEISNEIYFLLSIKGNKYRITGEQKEAIETADLDHLIQLEEGSLKMHQVAEIISIEDYYRSHPKERPSVDRPILEITEEQKRRMGERISEANEPLTRERYLHASRSMLEGIRQFISESIKPTPSAKILEEKLVQRIKDVKGGSGRFAKSQQELINQLN